jgi:hypothetical protein
VARFVDAFFSKFDQFQQPPRHPKWREVNLTAEVPGWTRFQPAQDWLVRQNHGGYRECRHASAVQRLPAPDQFGDAQQSDERSERGAVPAVPRLGQAAAGYALTTPVR